MKRKHLWRRYNPLRLLAYLLKKIIITYENQNPAVTEFDIWRLP